MEINIIGNFTFFIFFFIQKKGEIVNILKLLLKIIKKYWLIQWIVIIAQFAKIYPSHAKDQVF